MADYNQKLSIFIYLKYSCDNVEGLRYIHKKKEKNNCQQNLPTMYPLYSHDQLYKHICICMQNHNNDTIKTSDTVL